MSSSSRSIMWFRRDLRIEDNPALASAARDGSVFPVFIWCPKEEGQFYPGRVSRWWLKQSLIHLDKTLRSLGVELKIINAKSTLSALLVCISAVGATKVVYNHLYGRGWSPGWSNGDKVFHEFVENRLLDYSKDGRKVCGAPTSRLSPYLHFGEVSVRKVYHSIRMKQILWADEKNSAGEESATLYLRSIGLREYSRYICFNFPYTHERSLIGNLKYFPWHANQGLFKAWRQGRTGYPLVDAVDAGMRELWATGWMHNKIRVFVASFFVKFLMLPWQWGMKYFWDTLLDADLECDILGWQYISGSLPDGHELERLDSPQVQGFKYDPEGEYVRRWLPELTRMEDEWIHHPWEAPLNVLRSAGVELGQNYPKPIVDIDIARDRLTEAICIMRGAANTNGTNEVVGENSGTNEDLAIPKVVLKEKPQCPSTSSNDQRVPSMQEVKNGVMSKKRASPGDDENRIQRQNECSTSRVVHGDLSSTAESSSKRQSTSSRTSLSVPQMSNQVSKEASIVAHEYSGVKQQSQEEVDDQEEISSRTG